jgi:hypothetical protein
LISSIYFFGCTQLSILKNEINYDPLVNKSIDETYYKEIILNNYVINSKNLKDNFVYINDNGIVKVINIIQITNCKIKIEVTYV